METAKGSFCELGALETVGEAPLSESRKTRAGPGLERPLSWSSLNERCLSITVADPSCR